MERLGFRVVQGELPDPPLIIKSLTGGCCGARGSRAAPSVPGEREPEWTSRGRIEGSLHGRVALLALMAPKEL